MSEDPFRDRRRLTFEQAEGIEPLPTQLQPKEMPVELRAILWHVVHESLDNDIHSSDFGYRVLRETWRTILYDKHILRDHLMADEFDNDAKKLIATVKRIFEKGGYAEILGFVQFVLRHPKCPYRFPDQIDNALQLGHAAYRVLDKDTIIPISSETERATLEHAFADLATREFRGARSHLRCAGSELTGGNFASSVRESIHAVESVARTLEPSGQLGQALANLEGRAAIHPALKRGFSAIYGYTSDEKGIRHPLLDDSQAAVDESDALFMIGACAAFVSYLIGKARAAGFFAKNPR
jgi:hypothetical protein